MDKKDTKPENEFNFIQEKVVPRRKNKIKKFFITVGTTVLCAVVFGFIARIIFIKSEGLVNRILGIDTTERSELKFPSEDEAQNPNSPSGDRDHTLPSVTPTTEPTITPEPEKQTKPTIIEQKISASIGDYEKILCEIKKIASGVDNSLVTVTAIERKKDWQELSYESKESITGIILGENNAEMLILTYYDQISSATQLQVTFCGGFTASAKLWEYDEEYDLAVVAVKLEDISQSQLSSIKTAEFGESYALAPGSLILALGHPNGNAGSMEIGLITGESECYYMVDNRLDLYTTDISDNKRSNGVIVRMDGKIVGLITHKNEDNSKTGISTLIGISRLKPIIEKLTNRYDRIVLGITGEDIPADILKEYQLQNGIYVTDVLQDSPAYEADIRQGDIITNINEYNVASIANYASILNNYKPDQEIDVVLYRKIKAELKEMKIKVVLSAKGSKE